MPRRRKISGKIMALEASYLKPLLDDIMPQRVKTAAGRADAVVDEQDVYSKFLPDTKPDLVDKPEVEDELNEDDWEDKFERFTESSMAKSHLMARLTFDPNFRKKHFEKQVLKKETRDSSDISSNIFKTVD